MAGVTWTFGGCVDEQGKLHVSDREMFVRHLLTLAGKEIDLTVKRHRAQRGSQANRYYYGVVVATLADCLGYERDELHEALAHRFLSTTGPDDPLPRRRSTADLNTAEMAEYIDQCKRLASELGCYIPEPGEAEAA
jgi:hypothetical protein